MAIVYSDDNRRGKICNKCGEWKPVAEYHRSSHMKDGYKAACKICRNAANRSMKANRTPKRITTKPTITGKVCVGCREWKPVSAFSPLRSHGKSIGNGFKSRCKVCSNAQQRIKRDENRELYREKARMYMQSRRDQSNQYQRSWRAANDEKVQQSLQTYRQANREKLRFDAKRRRDANLEYHRAMGRKSYANNREKRKAYNRFYRKKHPERFREQVRIRRNRKYQAEGCHTEVEWESLKATYNYTCLRCGKREPEITLTRDHIVPLTQGGSDWITNIQPLCHTCNSSKNNKHIDYRTDRCSVIDSSPDTSEDH